MSAPSAGASRSAHSARAALGLVACLLLFSRCGGGDPAVGVLVSQSGPRAEEQRLALAAILQAWEEWPAESRPRLLLADDQGTRLGAVAAFDNLVEQGATAVIGPLSADAALAAAASARLRAVPLLAPSASGEEITRQNPYALRICAGDDDVARELAAFARYRLQIARVALVVDLADRHALGLADAFAREFHMRRGRVLDQISIHGCDEQAVSALERAAALDVEAVLIAAGHAPLMTMLAGCPASRLSDRVLLGDACWKGPGLDELLAERRPEGAWIAGHFHPDERELPSETGAQVGRFVDAFVARQGQPPDELAALAYDAARAMLAVYDRDADSQELCRRLRELQYVVGVTGTIHMESGGRPRSKTLVIEQLHDPRRSGFEERVGD